MELQLLIDNISNPILLLFFLGILAVQLKSDLEIPATSSKFIALYLLFAIGFKGGRALANSQYDVEIIWSLLFGIVLALTVPVYSYFMLRRKFGISNAAAIGACYGSVSAVTFVTAISFLELSNIAFGGHMVAVMALMEAPSIIVGVLLLNLFSKDKQANTSIKTSMHHALTNGSVLLILGSLIIGFVADAQQAESIKPFTTDLFKGFLAIFLLDMGITSGRSLNGFFKNGVFAFLFAVIIPLVNGIAVAYISGGITDSPGNRFLFAILAASASYIAVPAAMRLAAPKANPGLYLPMSLAITFPFNITLGMPIYLSVIQSGMSV